MIFIKTEILDVYIIEPSVFGDDRGYFLESFNLEKFQKNVSSIKFVQDNESKSFKGVLRGLHFQKPPFDQAKLVRCIEGRVMDIAVDIRKGSPTFLKYHSVVLSEENLESFFDFKIEDRNLEIYLIDPSNIESLKILIQNINLMHQERKKG